jgi:competence ComEA-like helix-hairpin-helix protein
MYRLGLVALAILFLPSYAHAELININTADATLLDTLPGIGPSKANAIIEYRTIHGLFVQIEDIQNVSGIGPSTYADIAPLITVGTAPPADPPIEQPDPPATSTSPATTTTNTGASGGVAEYLIIPKLYIRNVEDRIVSVGADTAFSAKVYDDKSNRRDDAIVTWTFGDGTRRTGMSVLHAYYSPGEYIVIVRATTSEGADAETEIVVTAKDARVRITNVSQQGIALSNSDTRPLDLSGWRLSSGEMEYRLPEDTLILGNKTIILPTQVLGFPIFGSATLFFPSGEIADQYPPVPSQVTVAKQIPTSTITSQPSQSFEPVEESDELAPNISLAGVGAALGEEVPDDETPSLFSSPWFLVFLGVILLSGVAFVFL